jgi:hypothetical protein
MIPKKPAPDLIRKPVFRKDFQQKFERQSIQSEAIVLGAAR